MWRDVRIRKHILECSVPAETSQKNKHEHGDKITMNDQCDIYRAMVDPAVKDFFASMLNRQWQNLKRGAPDQHTIQLVANKLKEFAFLCFSTAVTARKEAQVPQDKNYDGLIRAVGQFLLSSSSSLGNTSDEPIHSFIKNIFNQAGDNVKHYKCCRYSGSHEKSPEVPEKEAESSDTGTSHQVSVTPSTETNTVQETTEGGCASHQREKRVMRGILESIECVFASERGAAHPRNITTEDDEDRGTPAHLSEATEERSVNPPSLAEPAWDSREEREGLKAESSDTSDQTCVSPVEKGAAHPRNITTQSPTEDDEDRDSLSALSVESNETLDSESENSSVLSFSEREEKQSLSILIWRVLSRACKTSKSLPPHSVHRRLMDKIWPDVKDRNLDFTSINIKNLSKNIFNKIKKKTRCSPKDLPGLINSADPQIDEVIILSIKKHLLTDTDNSDSMTSEDEAKYRFAVEICVEEVLMKLVTKSGSTFSMKKAEAIAVWLIEGVWLEFRTLKLSLKNLEKLRKMVYKSLINVWSEPQDVLAFMSVDERSCNRRITDIFCKDAWKILDPPKGISRFF